MAMNWLIGDFATGAVNQSNVLPVIFNSDKWQVDINAGDNATFNVSKKDIPEDFQEYLKVADKLIVLEDNSKSWDDYGAVLFAGYINKIDPNLKQTIPVQAAGLREYLASRVINNRYGGVEVKPSANVTFEADNYQGLMRAVILHCFSADGIPSNVVKPPQVIGNVEGSTSGNALKYVAKLSQVITYSAVADELRDVTSNTGNEYYFKPRWADSSRTRIVWDILLGTEDNPHINEKTTITTNLNGTISKTSSFGMSLSADSMANRIIGQSTNGDEETDTGADMTVVTSQNGAKVLIDTVFNPGVELDSGQMTEQLQARLQTVLSSQGSASYVIEEADPGVWLANLGKTIQFGGSMGTDAAGYAIKVRITDIQGSASTGTITVGVMVPQPRYPKLPNAKNKPNKVNGTEMGSGFGQGTGTPISQKPIGNFTPPGAGGGGGITPPPGPTEPTFDETDTPFESDKPIYSDPVFTTHPRAAGDSENLFTFIFRDERVMWLSKGLLLDGASNTTVPQTKLEDINIYQTLWQGNDYPIYAPTQMGVLKKELFDDMRGELPTPGPNSTTWDAWHFQPFVDAQPGTERFYICIWWSMMNYNYATETESRSMSSRVYSTEYNDNYGIVGTEWRRETWSFLDPEDGTMFIPRYPKAMHAQRGILTIVDAMHYTGGSKMIKNPLYPGKYNPDVRQNVKTLDLRNGGNADGSGWSQTAGIPLAQSGKIPFGGVDMSSYPIITVDFEDDRGTTAIGNAQAAYDESSGKKANKISLFRGDVNTKGLAPYSLLSQFDSKINHFNNSNPYHLVQHDGWAVIWSHEPVNGKGFVHYRTRPALNNTGGIIKSSYPPQIMPSTGGNVSGVNWTANPLSDVPGDGGTPIFFGYNIFALGVMIEGNNYRFMQATLKEEFRK